MNSEGMGAGEKREGTEGEETVNRIYCMRKDFFNKKNGKSFLKNQKYKAYAKYIYKLYTLSQSCIYLSKYQK